MPFINGFRNTEVQLVQPVLPDNRPAIYPPDFGADEREGIIGAVIGFNHFVDFRMLLQRLFEVRGKLVNQVIELQNVALFHCFIRTARILQPGVEKNIRQLARGQQQAEFLVGHLRSAQLPDSDAAPSFVLLINRQAFRRATRGFIHIGQFNTARHRVREVSCRCCNFISR
ncbi:hypothetical protein D3C75_910170 [compost metagenome]